MLLWSRNSSDSLAASAVFKLHLLLLLLLFILQWQHEAEEQHLLVIGM
jgi:hypothetical protein